MLANGAYTQMKGKNDKERKTLPLNCKMKNKCKETMYIPYTLNDPLTRPFPAVIK